MSWRVAKSLLTLRDQVNAKFPARDKSSDGTKGDDAHASRTSDHNPDLRGIVHALDLTHDPASGFDSYIFADMLLTMRDSRVKYIISNRRIASGNGGPKPWTWRSYSGSNPHNHHCHISVNASNGDDDRAWLLVSFDVKAPVSVKSPPTLRRGDKGEFVTRLQTALNAAFKHAALEGSPPMPFAQYTVDGIFGNDTQIAVMIYQSGHGLTKDGVVGPQTWNALGVYT